MKALLKNIRDTYQAKAARRLLTRMGGETKGDANTQPLLILMYHRVLPEQDERLAFEEPGMYVTPETLSMQLKTLQPLVRFVDLGQWVKARREGRVLEGGETGDNRLCCAITFDDGWLDNYEFAMPVLREHGATATIFLATGFIGTGRTFWPEQLNRLLKLAAALGPDSRAKIGLEEFIASTGVKPDSTRYANKEYAAEVIAASKQFTDAQIYRFLDESFEHLTQDSELTLEQGAEMLDWHQVKTMAPTFDVGAHTVNHLRLNEAADPAAVDAELDGCIDAIQSHLGAVPSLFCYPNGDVSKHAREAVEQRFAAAVTTGNGINQAGDSLFALKRIGLHEDASNTPESFLAKLYRGASASGA
ncbi:polysaccharide deacetylase family protein [Allohahella marinimesophila]|uniref:Polysaccharide deacetylase family protein n=1 Tax=Allohahella marinimesophila TaxID=1054972 RepID=A0ABP7QB97_9GAMM